MSEQNRPAAAGCALNVDPSASVEAKDVKGNFLQSLLRGPGAIKATKAMSIYEETKMKFQAKVDELRLDIRKKEREMEDRLDLSPDDALSLKFAANFDCESFVNEQINTCNLISKSKLRLKEAEARFEYLFGEKPRV